MNDYSQDELVAIWEAFQRQSEEPTCPACGGRVHVELSRDPAEGESKEAEIYVECSNCGRHATDTPGAHDTYGWTD